MIYSPPTTPWLREDDLASGTYDKTGECRPLRIPGAQTACNTLKFAKTLEKAGIPNEQAEAMAEAFRDATSEELVTRDYLAATIGEAQNDIIKRVAGLLLGQAAVIAALVKLL